MIRSSVLLIVVDASTRDGRRAAPSRSPPTVAPAEGPATTRKVGSFTSHRRPSASTEPPAPGDDRRYVPVPTLRLSGPAQS
jgi:hypothetical protein